MRPPSRVSPRVRYSHRSRYEIVATLLSGVKGSLLDVGARDRLLASYLRGSSLRYFSADMSEGHDYAIDLEAPIPVEDGTFDVVVCLDVLEHVEAIHAAFSELARITSDRLIVSLPNIAVLRTRLRFLFRGTLGGKYDFGTEHQGDRHRWVTTHKSITAFASALAARNGLTIETEVSELAHGHRYLRGLALVGVSVGLLRRRGLLSERSILEFRKT